MATDEDLVPVDIMPGLYTLQTDRGSKNRWKNGEKVRFFRGMPQKIGGWAKATATTFLGICRAAQDWVSLAQSHIIAMGTHLKLYVYIGGAFSDITPIRISGTESNNPFTTINGQAAVSVSHAGHGVAVGDYVHWSGAATFNNVTMNGEFAVTVVTDANNFKVNATTTANAGSAGGGAAAAYQYEIGIGKADNNIGLGWGAGTYGTSTYGTARSSSSIVDAARIWTLDNWGEDLIANPRGGAMYVWDTSVGSGTRATVIGGSAPTLVKSIVVSPDDRHLIALGCDTGGTPDPLLIRWSDGEDYTNFTAASTNTAGRKRIDGGNEIYRGIKVGKEILVHTDAVAWAMVFEGPPYTFGFYRRGSNGGLMGPNACIDFDGRGFWMGKTDFFTYDGKIKTLPCDVRNHVYDSINLAQRQKIFASVNREFGEVRWEYPSASSVENDRYVIYNVLEDNWSFGTQARTVMVGNSKVFDPYGMSPSGLIYNHEIGVDDDGAAMISSLDSWDMEVAQGGQVMALERVVPDFKTLVGSISLTLKGRIWPQSTDQPTQSVGSITASTAMMNPHFRARQITLGLASSNIGDDWRAGTFRIAAIPDGFQ